MTITKQLFVLALFVACACALPHDRNPNLEFELLSDVPKDQSKPDLNSNTTPRTVIIKTPPPVAPDSKTFAFNPTSQTWTQLKKNSPPPSEDTLLWNQSNDKFLTNI